MTTLGVQRGYMSANGQRLCFDEEEGPSGCHHLGPWMNKIGDLLSWPDVIKREAYLSAFLAVMDTTSFGGLTDSTRSSILDGIGA